MEKKTIFDLKRISVDEYKRREKLPLTIVVDNVRSLNNIGSLFRTSDCFGVERIMLCGISSTPPSPEIHKTALGAEDSVDWIYFATTAEAIAALKAQGYTVCCLEQVKGSVSLQEYGPAPHGHYALVLGNEVDGVDPAIVDACDVCLEIPQVGTKHSLNVTVSASVAIWHFFTHWLKRADSRL